MVHPFRALLLGCLLCFGCAGDRSPGALEQAAKGGNGNGNGAGGSADTPDSLGTMSTFAASGSIDTTNPFFQDLGSNGRTCATCHVQSDGWTITPADVQARFDATTPKGTDPIFRTNDGSSSPNADVSTEAARKAAYSMLLTKGLIRVGIGIPPTAEFDLAGVDDPYGFASAAQLSLFRRPLPSTNVVFLATVMWDGRETTQPTVDADLLQQANDATLGHAQAMTPLTDAQRRAIVDFEEQLFTAQSFDGNANNLIAQQANGGPQALANQPFHIGINDVLGKDPAPNAPPFSSLVFDLYDSWSGAPGGGVQAARASIARGQALFNTKSINITGVKGLNDKLGISSLSGTCTTCHDTPNVGDHSVGLPIDIGIVSLARRTPDLPLYTLHNKTTNDTIQVTDPGRALITGKWADIGKFKGPILRGLAARPPYFHNGSAAGLSDVVDFYDGRFGIGFSAQERADLIAFLGTL
jgi:hypothetical protein